MRLIQLAIMLLFTQQSFALGLEEYLNIIKSKHRSYQAFGIQKEAAGDRREQGNLELAPVLTLKGSYLDDKKTNATTNTYLMTHTQYREYSLGLGKKFSSGTSAQVSAGVTEGTFETLNMPGSIPGSMQQSFGSLGIALSQSLWKNSFGRGTRLRWEREAFTEKAEQGSFDLQMKQLLIEAEAAFWDHIYWQEELTIRKESLARAARIQNWVARRVGNGIGDRADLLNAKGLMAARELELLQTQDELVASTKKISDLSEIKKGEALPVIKEDLGKVRTLPQIAGFDSKSSNRIMRLDSYLAVLEAKAKAIAAEEVSDSMRPDLVLEGSYKTNSIESSMSAAANKMNDQSKPTAAVAVKLTWIIDDGSKSSVQNLARSEALAASLKKERKLLDSDTSWEEIQRRHFELGKKIQAAANMNEIQSQKAAAERDKLSKGRSITLQVITAEQDAAEAELTLTKLKAEQRKLESQGRMFIRAPESI